nr:hypothetical protein [Nitrosopumilus sp.]
VGVCESRKTDTNNFERKKGVLFNKLIDSVALGKQDEDTLTSLGGRLAKLGIELNDKDRKEVEEVAKKPMKELIQNLFNAHDPDIGIEKAKSMFNVESPTREQLRKSPEELIKTACVPFDNPHPEDVDIAGIVDKSLEVILVIGIVFLMRYEKRR